MADLLGIYTAFEEGKPLSDYWADLGLFNLQPDRVKKIIIHHFSNDQKIPITGLGLTPDKVDPKKTSWDFLRPELSSRLDPDKVIRFIATLNSIKGQKIMDPAGKGYGLEKPVTEIAVTEGDKEIVLSVGLKDKKEGFYYAKVSTSPSIFRINGYFFGDLDVDDARFFKESSPAKEGETHLPSQSGQFSTETLQKPKAA